MREHMGLYRGKRVENGEWVAGYYACLFDCKGNVSHRIYSGYAETDYGDFYPEWYEVDPDTVGECAGLPDVNGKLIFEGDILEGMRGLHRVYYDTTLACFEWAKINGNWKESFSGFADEYEIIGNIHDNPELLESEG